MANTSAVPGTPKNKSPAATLQTEINSGLARDEMIAAAAYYHAEQRGFTSGDRLADWLSAEAEIDAIHRNHQTQQAKTTPNLVPV